MKRTEVNEWDRFWKLVVIEEVEQQANYTRMFKCKCECWNIWIFRLSVLASWRTKSCWCSKYKIYKKANLLNSSEKLIRMVNSKNHWMSGTKLHLVWWAMLQRCFNVDNQSYKKYGLRGILVCEKWLTFEEFYEDMWETFKKWLTIDRIDNNWNYCKENCEWRTYKEQNNNKRNNIMYKWLCLLDNIKKYNKKSSTTYNRVQNLHWTIEEALWIVPRI